MVRHTNVDHGDTRPPVTLVHIEHVITHGDGIDRTSIPVCSSCQQNRQTVASEQIDELSSVGVAVAFKPDVKITDDVNRLLKRRYGVKNTRQLVKEE